MGLVALATGLGAASLVLAAGGGRSMRRGRLMGGWSQVIERNARAWPLPARLERLAPWARALGAGDPSRRLQWGGVGLPAEAFLALRLVGLMAGVLGGLAFGGALGGAVAPWVGGVAGGVAGWQAPEVWLARRIAARRAAIDGELLYFVDYLALTAAAGVSLAQALQQVAQELPGILSAAFEQVRLERGMGQWNEDALANLVERVGHPEVAALAEALARAGRFGSRTADVLRALTATIRAQRHERMRERSYRAGAAIILPVAVFILPAIVLVIGYPAVTMVTAALGSGGGG